MLIKFNLLNTSKIVSAEVDETKTPLELSEQIKALFDITDDGAFVLNVGK